jgi:hypothetical protein
MWFTFGSRFDADNVLCIDGRNAILMLRRIIGLKISEFCINVVYM